MFGHSRVVVVVPAYEEAPRIGRVVRSMPPMADIIVLVDDASRDDTSAAALAVGDPRVVIVRHAENRGVGAAIVTGYQRALELTSYRQDAFVVMAGDGQMAPEDLPALVAPIADGACEYAKGDRMGDPAILKVMPRGRYLGGRVFSALTSAAIGVPVRDSQCGYTAISREACAALDLDALWTGYGYPNDLLGALARKKMRIAHVPVRPVYADEVSRLKLKHLPTIGGLIARAFWRRIRA